MAKEFKNYLNLLSLTPDTTYVVSKDCTISTNLVLPDRISLIFKGGKITVTGTLTGTRTSIVAPISEIFITSDVTSIDGTWDIDQAYPRFISCPIRKLKPIVNKVTPLRGLAA